MNSVDYASTPEAHGQPRRGCARWLRVLVLFLLSLPVLADGSDGGGDGGVINLPNARNNSNRSSSYRMRVALDDYRPGVVLRMPNEMREGIAFFLYEQRVTPVPFADGQLVLDAETLTQLRTAEVYEFDITLTNSEQLQLLLTVELEADSHKVTVTVW